jgi:hypothetical protein
MDLHDDRDRARLRQHLGGLLRGRRLVCGIGPLAGLVEWVTLVDEAGGERPLLVASGVGAGPTPTAEQAEVVFVDLPTAPSMTEDLRRHDRLVRDLPAEVVAAVEAYDPDGVAGWLVSPFIGTAPILGREVLTGRPDAWGALEDKLVVDALWDAVGVPRAPSRTVPVDADALRRAAADLDAGDGVVWAGDARDGFNGGGDFVRWVASGPDGEAAATLALEFFAERCDRVRVMPFLDGVPCSIHGLVLPDGTAVFRPVELAILRRPDRGFVYGGLGTSWDPPPADREQMRDLARRTGEHLRGQVGYRGAFGVDGVLTADGFRPTELNSRLSGGLGSMARVADASLFHLLQFNLVAGRDPGVDAASLERWAVEVMDAQRFAKAVAIAPAAVAAEPVDVPVRWEGSRLARSAEATGWQVSAGPNGAGTFVRLDTPEDVGGIRAGDLNVALLEFLDRELGAGFGEVRPAPDVRRDEFRSAARSN